MRENGAPAVTYRTAGGLSVTRLQPAIGAEITGADLCRPIPDAVAADLRQALLDHGVIFFRDQPIDYVRHVALGRIFGEPSLENILPDRPELMVLESDAGNTNPAGGHWHSDGTYLAIPHAISILHAVRAAPLGGDTLFASAVAAYQGLPDELKARIAPLRARASMSHIRKVKQLADNPGYTDSAAFAALPDWVEHPVVRVHPETGKPALYVNECHTMDIIGLDPAESAALLRQLSDQFRRPEYQMRWRWTDHAVAIWDNRQVQHYAVQDETGPRHVERLAITGTPHIGITDVQPAAALDPKETDMDLALRNAPIVDRAVQPREDGDVGVGDGRIAAIGQVDGTAREEIDVGGAVVAPGFIDCHTHYDAQISWDDMLAPSVYHGVTTVIAGNCGFTLAPLSGRPEDVDYLLGMLSTVEGMPVRALKEAVQPDWRSFGEFLDRFDGKLAINTAFMVGHTALRTCVMGERAVGHEATPEDIEAMVALLRRSLAEGGMGLSTTTSVSHSDHRGDPVPSRWASEEELLTLARVVRDYPGTWIEIVPGVGPFGEKENRLVTELSLAAQRPVNWNAMFVDVRRKGLIDSQLEMGRYAAARGARVYGLTPGGPLKGFLNFRSGFTFAMLDGWKPFVRLSDAEKIAAMKDPEYRARLKAGAENPNNPAQVLSGIENYVIEDLKTEKNAAWRHRTIGDYAAATGKTPFDALFDLAVEEELSLIFSGPPMGADDASWDMRSAIWRDEHIILGGSDAGAHLDMFNTFALTTQLLGEAVRERSVVSLEEGVRRITSEQADVFGLAGRGRIAEGAVADLTVFDPDTVACGPISMRNDLPCGEARLYGDAIGIHHVIVGGVPVAADNRPTGRRGGRMLRSGRDTRTVPLT